MPKTYKNPPILEAVCEFRFVLSKDYSQNQIGAFYKDIEDIFPTKKKGKIHRLEFKIDAKKSPEENQKSVNQDFHEFDQYISNDEKYSVQLDVARLSIHRLKPYLSWKDFSPVIQKVYKAYLKNFSVEKINRIGIRYINEILLPIKGFSFPEYFNIKASLPSLEENNQIYLFLSSVFEQENGRDAIKVQFSENQQNNKVDNRSFVLDFDYFLIKPTISTESVETWLKKAHANLENVFEGIIKEKTREFFDK